MALVLGYARDARRRRTDGRSRPVPRQRRDARCRSRRRDRMAAAGLGGLPVAPTSQRVDLVAPPFSNPTSVTNPLFPISDAALGRAERQGRRQGRSGPRRRCCRTRGSSSGAPASASGRSSRSTSRISAVGSRRSRSTSTPRPTTGRSGTSARTSSTTAAASCRTPSGTWLAGKEGPGRDDHARRPGGRRREPRPRTSPASSGRRSTVKAVGRTVAGPRGPVAGAIVGQRAARRRRALDDKIFAPGYGEFFSARRRRRRGARAGACRSMPSPDPPPAALRGSSSGANAAFTRGPAGGWSAPARAKRSSAAWQRASRAAACRRRLVGRRTRALDGARARSRARDRAQAARRRARRRPGRARPRSCATGRRSRSTARARPVGAAGRRRCGTPAGRRRRPATSPRSNGSGIASRARSTATGPRAGGAARTLREHVDGAKLDRRRTTVAALRRARRGLNTRANG